MYGANGTAPALLGMVEQVGVVPGALYVEPLPLVELPPLPEEPPLLSIVQLAALPSIVQLGGRRSPPENSAPKVADAPGARLPFQAALVTVTVDPETVALPLHESDSETPCGSWKVRVQLETAVEPLLVTTKFAL